MAHIEIDDRSEYRCDHWVRLAEQMKSHLLAKNLPPIKLSFFTKEDEKVVLGEKTRILFGMKPWEVSGAIEDQEGYQRAQALVGKNYLRIWGIPECPDQREIENIKRLLDRLLPQVVEQDPVKLASLIQAGREEARKKSREAYVAGCSARFEKTVAGTRQAIKDGHAAVAQLQQQLVKKIRETSGCERKLEQLENCRHGEADKYGQEFDKLLAVPKVRDVQVVDGVVKVFTDTLTCADPRTGKRHEIGAFRIEIYTNGASNGVRWFNLTRRVDAYKYKQMAPHVWDDGSACLGNTAEVFPELIGNYEFAAAAMVAIQFVESVNTDDAAGKHINKWPEAPAAEVK